MDNVIERTVSVTDVNITAPVSVKGGEVSKDVKVFNGREMYKGDKGASAYEIAVANGFEGTEEEWLESLKSPFTDEDKAKVDCLTKESIGHVDPVTGEITNKDEVIVYQSQTSRRVRGYNDEVNVDRPIWYNDADGDNVYDNSGINLHMKDPVIYNDALNSEMPRGKFLVKASAEPGNWAWVGIFKGRLEDEDLDGSVKAEVYCYLDAWQNSPYCPHEALHGREFDILSIYDGYSQIHGSYWFFPPCEYTLALFGDDSYNNLIETVYFRVLDGAWRSRGYDDDFMYNPATKTLKVKNIECDNLPDAGSGEGSGPHEHDWYDINNAPFNGMTGDTLIWDGDTTDREVVNTYYYKVSDCTPSYEDLSKGCSIYNKIISTGAEYPYDTTITVTDYTESSGYCYVSTSKTAAAYIYYDGNASGVTPGIYLRRDSVSVYSRLIITDYTGFEPISVLKDEALNPVAQYVGMPTVPYTSYYYIPTPRIDKYGRVISMGGGYLYPATTSRRGYITAEDYAQFRYTAAHKIEATMVNRQPFFSSGTLDADIIPEVYIANTKFYKKETINEVDYLIPVEPDQVRYSTSSSGTHSITWYFDNTTPFTTETPAIAIAPTDGGFWTVNTM